MKDNGSICSFPWRAAAIRPNGLTIPCCRYPHIDESDSFVSSPVVRNTAHWKDIRKKMLKLKNFIRNQILKLKNLMREDILEIKNIVQEDKLELNKTYFENIQ